MRDNANAFAVPVPNVVMGKSIRSFETQSIVEALRTLSAPAAVARSWLVRNSSWATLMIALRGTGQSTLVATFRRPAEPLVFEHSNGEVSSIRLMK